ncbi:2-keto-3-deoxygluconate kinase [Nocardia alni]|uniref:2-keto-3-deoxygluconate kinase n=1 Tax=Nocardia alni TaxID=2815723 RepID=UPI001C21E8C8|nr:2-keto-3-deoxygluconate kinase [Nocardia alni]
MTLTINAHDFITAAPRAMRTECGGLTPAEFFTRFCEQPGGIRLGDWSRRDSAYTATLEFGDRLRTVVSAGSPVAALTSALYEEGYPVEILQFHQRKTGAGIATFVQCECNGRRGWGAALAADGPESTVRAMLSGINSFS